MLLLEQLQVCIFAEIVFGVRCTLTTLYMYFYLEMFENKEKSCYSNLTGINLPVKVKQALEVDRQGQQVTIFMYMYTYNTELRISYNNKLLV